MNIAFGIMYLFGGIMYFVGAYDPSKVSRWFAQVTFFLCGLLVFARALEQFGVNLSW